MDSFDIETFVELVRVRPALWDIRSEEYTNKIRRKESWLEVFRILVDDFDDLSGETKEKVSSEIQRKWKSLRNCFTRELMKQKAEKAGPNASYRRRYIYFDLLTFLVPALLEKTSHYLAVSDEDKTLTQKKKDGTEEATAEKEKERERDKLILPTLKRRKSEADDVLQEVNKALGDLNKTLKESLKCGRQHENTAEDEDKLFLLSLHKDLKSIPPEKRLMAKVELMQVLHNHKNC